MSYKINLCGGYEFIDDNENYEGYDAKGNPAFNQKVKLYPDLLTVKVKERTEKHRYSQSKPRTSSQSRVTAT